MSPERTYATSAEDLFILHALSPRSLDDLLQGDELQRYDRMQVLKVNFLSMNDERRHEVVRKLVLGVSSSDPVWSLERRKGAFKVLTETVGIGKIPQEKLDKYVLDAINQLSKESDPFGSIRVTLDLIKCWVGYISEGVYRDVIERLRSLSYSFEDEAPAILGILRDIEKNRQESVDSPQKQAGTTRKRKVKLQ